MSEPDDIDCWGTDEAVCPYCGNEEDSSHEFFDGSHRDTTTASCSACDKDYELSRDFSVTYTSRRVETARQREVPQ